MASITSLVTESINGKAVTVLPPFVVNGGAPNLVFPRELRDATNNWPFVSFGLLGNEKFAISLPIPPGITFTDNMLYSTMNLGLIGSALSDNIDAVNAAVAGKSLRDVSTLAAGGGAMIGGMAGAIASRAKNLNAAAALSIASRNFRMDSVADVLDYANKQVVAPNTNTTFQGSGVRTFGFTFKMIPKTQADSTIIKKIVAKFREFAYPEGTNVIMKYPPKWSIKFYNGETENTYIPKIYDAYLTSLSSSYNPTSNMFHADGSPVEVDVGLTFQETKALSRTDILGGTDDRQSLL